MYKNDGVEEKIMNNNPKVASVNMVNDIIGDSNKGIGFKILVGVLTFCLVAVGVGFIILGRIFAGVVLVLIGAVLVITTMNIKLNRKKYRIDEKKIKEIEPLFKD